MNELLRVFDRLLKPSGYRIRQAEKYVLRPLRNLRELPESEALGNFQRGFEGLDVAELGAGLDELVVGYRTCLRSDRRTPAARPGGVSHEQVVLRCLYSLVRSVNHALRREALSRVRIRVLDDLSDGPELAKIEAVLKRADCPVEVVTTRQRGQGKSLHENFAFGATQDCLVYFCEDDYLHLETAIAEMAAFYQVIHRETGGHLVLHPQEQMKLYSPGYPSYVFLSDVRHWRTTSHMTHSFLTHGHVARDHWTYFENSKHVGDRKKRRLGSEQRTTNRLLAIMPGFCPIPALGAHFHEGTLPPFFEWQALWSENDVADLLAEPPDPSSA